MKTPFLLSHKILAIVSTVILFGCITVDVLALMINFIIKSDWVFITNLALSAVSIGVFITLIIKPEFTGVVSKPYTEESIHILSATRTYICIVYLDVALILALVVFGSEIMPNAELSIIAVAAIIFITGAVKYIFDSRKINQSQKNPDETLTASAKENVSQDDRSDKLI